MPNQLGHSTKSKTIVVGCPAPYNLLTMALYRKQHFLPAAYLRYFSDDQKSCTRDSRFWSFDGEKMGRVSVESQCFENYYYSKTRAKEVEDSFRRKEILYCERADTVRKEGKIPAEYRTGFILLMVDFALRNGIHKNKTGREGISAYHDRLSMFFEVLLLEKQGQRITNPEILLHIDTYWRLEIISAPAASQFATSDNPAVFCSFEEPTGEWTPIQVILLPIDPYHVAFAFDSRFLSVPNNFANFQDLIVMNHLQFANAARAVYVASAFSEGDLVELRQLFTTKRNSICEVTNEGWRTVKQCIPPQHNFSFVSLLP